MVTAWQKLWKLFLKYKEVLLYLIFGGLTTLVNFIVYAVCARGFCLNTLQANASALIISILFAYITNKIFVACRLGTGALDMAFMYVSVDILGFYDILMKILSNVIVIILNYIFSKLIVFAKK